MATPTCSTFFDRLSLQPYQDGNYLLAANGPVIETYDIAEYDKERTLKDAHRKHPPSWLKRTVASSTEIINRILVLEKSHDIVAIGSEWLKDTIIVRATLVPKKTILTGGTIASPMLTGLAELKMDEKNYLCETVTGTNSFVMVTSRAVRVYEVDDDGDFSFERSVWFEDRFDLLRPLCVAPSLQFEFFALTNDDEVVLMQWHEDEWILGHVNGKYDHPAAAFIPNQACAVVAGATTAVVVQTSLKGRVKNMLPVVVTDPHVYTTPMQITVDAAGGVANIFIACAQGIISFVFRRQLLRRGGGLRAGSWNFCNDVFSAAAQSRTCPLTKLRDDVEPSALGEGIVSVTTRRTKRGSHDFFISFEFGTLIAFNAKQLLQVSLKAEIPRAFCTAVPLGGCGQTKMRITTHPMLQIDSYGRDSYPVTVFSTRGSIPNIYLLQSNGTLISNVNLPEELYTNQGEILCADWYLERENIVAMIGTTHTLFWLEFEERKVLEIVKKGSPEKFLHMNTVAKMQGTTHAIQRLPLHDDQRSLALVIRIIGLESRNVPVLQLMNNDSCGCLHFIVLDLMQWFQHNLISFGNAKGIRDVWLVNDHQVEVRQIKNYQFTEPIEVYSSDWKGKIKATSSCSLYSIGRKNLKHNIVAVAKENGCVLILMHSYEESAIDRRLMLARWPDINGMHFAGIHIELADDELDCNQDENENEIGVRLYLLRKTGSIIISHGSLISNGRTLTIENVRRLGKVETCVTRPIHFVVTNITNQPKYAIVTSASGTQVVRICSKKLNPAREEQSVNNAE